MKSLLRFSVLTVLILSGGILATARPDGTTVYKEKCAMCHGPEGKGFPALKTPDFTDPKWQAGVTDAQIIDTIKNGKKGTPMPAFSGKLSDDEIAAVKDYVRSLGKK
jgi:cbb3-type cytochrome c oxidase subunit III